MILPGARRNARSPRSWLPCARRASMMPLSIRRNNPIRISLNRVHRVVRVPRFSGSGGIIWRPRFLLFGRVQFL